MATANVRLARRDILACALICMMFISASRMRAEDTIEWHFGDIGSGGNSVHIEPGRMVDGLLAGETAWDPYVWLKMPADGIDATTYTWLTVRLYSSEQADVLDIYYESPDGKWCLGGKLWLNESDHRTHLTDPSAGYGRADNLSETLGVYWRELAAVITRRAAVSWFDMGGGWFSDSQILNAMRRGHELSRESLTRRQPFQREIGVFVDPESFYWMRPTDANPALVLYQVATMPQSGAPWDFLLLDDIDASWLPDYKLYLFLNAFHVTPRQRETIHAKLKRNGATALFVYAPGYLGESGESLSNMQALTGIKIARLDRAGTSQVRLEAADRLASGLPDGLIVGRESLTVEPLFYADDPQARVVGRLVESGQTGLVVKTMEGWTSVYSAALQLPPALIRNLARTAGVHIWLDTDDAVYADGQYAAVHAASDGPKVLHLPAPCRAFDAVTGERLDSDGSTVTLPMKRAQTVLLHLEPLH